MDHSEGGRDAAFSVTEDDHGVVRLTWAAGAHIDELLAKEAMVAVDELNGDRRRPLLIQTSGPTETSRGARAVFSEPCSVSRVAMAGRSAVDQMVANFVIRLMSPPVPTRFFTSESDAMQWLRDDRSSG